MKLVFDSSSIFQAIIENKVSILAGNYTLKLAKYELGNLVWKRRALMKDLEREECKKLMEIIKGTLNLMEVLDIECHEAEVAELAESLNLTFYDASYIFLAKSKGIPLSDS
ncbi:type II toxin-antitoxin system VapC family toxin [Candidatus Bathyarchaeota archaeon]|nr:type II toxin-antitoxin system VapC family toxin [Candidatus Bathyarchaeota archaeon]